MKIFFLRLLFIFTILFFEFSFLDVLFPWISAPIIILVSVIAWSLLVSFPRVFFTSISFTVLFDIVSTGMPGIITLYAVILVYATNFLSRRLLVEHHGRGITLYAFFASSSVLGFDVFKFIFSHGNLFFWTRDTLMLFFSSVFSQNLLFSMFLCVPLFILAYFCISRFEKYMSYETQGESLQMR